VAGQIEAKSGEVIFAPNLKWHHFPLQAHIEKELHLPVRIINDVRAITLGEWLFGAGKGCQDLLCVFVGTGIGSGVVSGGELLTGCSNAFGEIGHVTMDWKGPRCTCGKQGCFEALAGGWGIAARAQEAIQADKKENASQCMLHLAGGKLSNVTAKVVVEAYYQKDRLAMDLMQNVKKVLIAGFASLVNAYNPCRLILGGGLIDGMPELIEVVEKGIKEIALKAATQRLEVVAAQLGKEVGVIGSAAAIFQMRKKERT
jgi:glucokinase